MPKRKHPVEQLREGLEAQLLAQQFQLGNQVFEVTGQTSNTDGSFSLDFEPAERDPSKPLARIDLDPGQHWRYFTANNLEES